MTLFGGINRELLRAATCADPRHCRRDPIAGTLQRYQVGFRAAAGQYSEAVVAIANQFAHPPNHLRFEHRGGWTVPPGACVLVERRAERICPHTDCQWSRIELSEVMRTGYLHRVRRHVARELIENVLNRRTLLW